LYIWSQKWNILENANA